MKRHILLACFAVLVLCALVSISTIGEANVAEEAFSDKWPIPEGASALLLKARNHGHAKVIVIVDVPSFLADSRLSKAQAGVQRATITRAQDRVISNLKSAGLSSANAYKFKYAPHIAMTVDETTLRKLQSLPNVVRVREDMVIPLTPGDRAMDGVMSPG